MNISDILNSVKNGKLSVKEAKKQLSLYSIEEIENFAKIDLGREARKGIPEVIFAERKENSEVKKIIIKVLKKTNAIVVSRIPKKNYQDVCKFCKKNNLKISTGQKTGNSSFNQLRRRIWTKRRFNWSPSRNRKEWS